MRRISIFILGLVFLLSACAQAAQPASSTNGAVLKVSGSAGEKTYTMQALESLGSSQAEFKGVTYAGVPLAQLLRDAGFDPEQVKAVKAVAADGFSANYDPGLVNKTDTLVAYAQADGPLTADDGAFRMVLPDQEGKMNVRQLVEIQVIQ